MEKKEKWIYNSGFFSNAKKIAKNGDMPAGIASAEAVFLVIFYFCAKFFAFFCSGAALLSLLVKVG
ncbi:hypothetical protein [Bacillus sp. SD088]|uniref:hypothetical protein n=1 Tax=Bacillus sp. SD088 TaxID=2782012 RepID=UPI001A95F65B|nr:hypothetical protein [Bacillus sp. SD088]MBO0992144.1 hypothetical protein [Bacillus sp. SD088]